jgi:hypothetical protein
VFGHQSVRRVLEERQLRWFGHVYRMERERKPKQFMEAQAEGRKQRGRQRIAFESRIEEIGSRRGKTLAGMKRQRSVEELEEGAPDALMAQRERKRRISSVLQADAFLNVFSTKSLCVLLVSQSPIIYEARLSAVSQWLF